METEVQSIFNEIAECGSVSNQHSHLLFNAFKDNYRKFKDHLEGCYLKIVKYYAQLNKKQRKVFEDVTERFFTHIFKDFEKTKNDQNIEIVRHFLNLFSDGVESTSFLTRVCCSRHLFMLLRSIPPPLLNLVVQEKLACDLITATVGLFRSGKGQQSKTERGLAIKLSAYLQYLKSAGRSNKFSQSAQILISEMVRTVSEEETNRLRLDALTNLELREDTFNCIVMRIRDKDISIRQQVVKKLMKSKIIFEQLSMGDRYQLTHDGLRNSSPEVRLQFQQLLLVQFCIIREEEENGMKEMVGEQDELKKRPSQARKRVSLSSDEFQFEIKLMRRTWKRFIGMFEVERTLLYPHLHDTVVEATRSIIKNYKQTSEVAVYLKDLFIERMGNGQGITTEELFLVRIAVTTPRQELDQTIYDVIDSYFLDGCQLADFIQGSDCSSLLQISELIKLAEAQINTDQKGKIQLQLVLKKLIIQPRQISAQMLQNDNSYNDVYELLTQQEIDSKWYGQHHFETPIILDFNSLVPLIVKSICKLFANDSSAFAIMMYELIFQEVRGQLLNPKNENNLYAQKRQTEVKLKIQQEQIIQLDTVIKDLKKPKIKNTQQIALMEAEYKESINYRDNLTNTLKQIIEQITLIDTHSLSMIDGVFSCIDINLTNEPYCQKLIETVLSLSKYYHEESEQTKPKLLALKCLAYIPLFGQEQGQTYIRIFKKILSETLTISPAESLSGDDPILIIALRCLMDYMLLYPIDSSNLGEDQSISPENMITALALKSRGVLQCTALEGISKLLLHQRIANPQVYVATLLFLWFDKTTKQSYIQTYIITTFFRCLITSNLNLLQTFERSFEVYVCVCCFLSAKTKSKLNYNFLQSGHWQENSIINNTIIGLNMMKFQIIQQHDSFTQLKERMQKSLQNGDEYFLGPQEEFLFFLCKMIGEYKNTILRPLLTLNNFDFYNTYDLHSEGENKIQVESVIYELIQKYLKQTIQSIEDKSKKADQEFQFLDKINEILGDKDISTNCLIIAKKLEEDFEEQKASVNHLVKFFKDQSIIIDDLQGNRGQQFLNIVKDKVLQETFQRSLTIVQSNDMEEQSENDDSELVRRVVKREKPVESESEDQKYKEEQDDQSSVNVQSFGRKKAIQKPKGRARR